MSHAPARKLLFACTLNAVRSVMAARLWQAQTGQFAQSCGVMAGPPDGFAAIILAEKGMDILDHESCDFASLDPAAYDLVITMSEEARLAAADWAEKGTELRHWTVGEPGGADSSREQILAGYRQVCERIATHLAELAAEQGENP